MSLLNVSFKDTAFLEVFGLSDQNIISYFALSQFYDKSSLNEQINMQARFNQLSAVELDRRFLLLIQINGRHRI